VRKRRTRFTWFPVIGGDESSSEPNLLLSTTSRSFPIQIDSSVFTDVFPLIPDETREEAGASDQLVDFIGTNWLIARLVGKLHLAYSQDNSAPGGVQNIPPAALISAGFFVARADANQPSVPIGDDNNLGQDYSPLALATQREPWMWRRTWVLGNNAAPATSGSFPDGFAFPATNSSRSVVDGPHIDCKVKRRSSNDERLWFAISGCAWTPGTGSSAAQDGSVVYTLDLRVLGALRKQKNRSAF